jgi:hypothetical protein
VHALNTSDQSIKEETLALGGSGSLGRTGEGLRLKHSTRHHSNAASPIGFPPSRSLNFIVAIADPRGDEGEVEKGRSGIAVAIISGVPHVPLDTPGEC